MNMPDGNTAALRQHEANQDRLEKQAPTEYESRRYVDDWLERKRDKMGVEFIMEALNECDEAARIVLFRDFKEPAIELGYTVKAIVHRYWRPSAEAAAAEHNFAEDRGT